MDEYDVHERLRIAINLLAQALPIVEADARMAADLTRHAPFPAEAQAIHDSTEWPSEILLPKMRRFLQGASNGG